MELRDFAEAVLFATTLEEKLRCPELITDDHPGTSLIAPESPGRPKELRFKGPTAGKGDFPGLNRLDDQRERGRLLHFFANHELLATELMALVLLRFPDAPAAFRRGVLQTLKDEQEHTRLYVQRMEQCGIRFGEMPVSGYFWRAISGMESPMDYVAGLSLTFEQANLDFAQQFSRSFAAVGDADSARLLTRIYQDEIGHVAHGLKWFRRWKDPRQSDWAAFCGQLKFPLSPNRAKGTTLNVGGRKAAGFDPNFIAELNVYAQSKGRTPNVFLFNPFAEAYIALGKSFTPAKEQTVLMNDLANLPQFLCRADDIVLVPARPSVDFLSVVKQAGFALPEFLELQAGRIPRASSLADRKIGSLRPWAWSPDSLEVLETISANVTAENMPPGPRYGPAIAQLYSKAWSAAFLRRVLALRPEEFWLCTEHQAGVAANTLPETLDAIESIRKSGHHKIVVKEALGLAGHNAIRLWEPEILEAQQRWMAKSLEKGPLVVEPWLDRVMDFSIQLEMGPRGLKLRGYTGLINDLRGQFLANWANYARRIPMKVTEQFREPAIVRAGIQRIYEEVFSLLENEFRRAGYFGPAGIDAFVYRTARGDPMLKPIVEINPRYTMGRLAIELMAQTCPGSHGLFRLVNRTLMRREGFDGFETFAKKLTEKFPVRLAGSPVSKIQEGALCLNDPARAETCLAIFQVSPTLEDLLGTLPVSPVPR